MLRLNRDILRILDANVNRAAEGMRVLEETARMLYDNAVLALELKDLRHAVTGILAESGDAGSRMILARDSERDVLREGETLSESTRTDLSSVIRANARRACEAVRALEEYGKLLEPGLSERYKRVRFRLYDLEKSLTERALRKTLLSPRRLGVWVIIDRAGVGDLAACTAETAAAAGAGTIVIRDKVSGDRSFLSHSIPIIEVLRGKDITVLVNDRVDAAVMLGADGVVLGDEDAPIALVRSLMGGSMLAGRSGSRKYASAGIPTCVNHTLVTPSAESLEGADFLLLAGTCGADVPGGELRRSAVPVVAVINPGEDESGDLLDAGAAGICLFAERYGPAELARVVARVREEFECHLARTHSAEGGSERRET